MVAVSGNAAGTAGGAGNGRCGLYRRHYAENDRAAYGVETILRREDEQMTAFREFVLREGESLYWRAAFDALHAWQVQQDPLRWGWPAWPKAFQDI